MTREAAIGVLCLETTLPTIPGHIRDPDTFPFPVMYGTVPGATPDRLVTGADPRLLDPFVAAARKLEADGAAAITGACGFLVLFQERLTAAVGVPLYASGLIQLPMIHRMLRPDRKVGLLVADRKALTRRHLAAIDGEGVPVCVAGMAEQPEFREVLLEGRRGELDVARLEGEVVGQVERLARDNPDLGALLIECADLAPFAAAVQARVGLPVFDVVTLTRMVHATLTRHPR
ncbi:aspartate/glutamate racemase family protein [Nonomuraea jiangxiensis]|uniref:aspartate/glutamate racemase family protein n=1 Tax=Nonomuraea jiangxiensis TaxID=633440 RepID=UPI001FEBBE04|nr:aspartate/glutamate racemase family protein [Nonomuraea jiangxiensis]